VIPHERSCTLFTDTGEREKSGRPVRIDTRILQSAPILSCGLACESLVIAASIISIMGIKRRIYAGHTPATLTRVCSSKIYFSRAAFLSVAALIFHFANLPWCSE
jgi:hypothetical protein